MPLPVQLILIALVFGLGLFLMVYFLKELDQPPHPPPPQFDEQ